MIAFLSTYWTVDSAISPKTMFIYEKGAILVNEKILGHPVDITKLFPPYIPITLLLLVVTVEIQIVYLSYYDNHKPSHISI